MKARGLTRLMPLVALWLLAGCRKPGVVSPDLSPPAEQPTADTGPGEQALTAAQAADVVASFLGVSASDVRTESCKEDELGYVIVSAITSRTGPAERVRLEVSSDMQSLRGCRWLNDPPEGQATLNAEQAKLVAQALYDRWFPQVPVNMAREAAQIDPTTFMVTWAARLSQEVYSGDRVMALISAVDGRPLAYAQYVAVKRPAPADITIKAKRAIEIAEGALKSSPHADRRVAGGKVVLILSAPQSRKGDPLWFVDFMFAQPQGGAQAPPFQVVVNGYTGEIETDLLEVFSIDRTAP